jgi:hypothetical protein
VLKQIHEKVTNWDSKENNEACLLINELIYKYFFLIIELRKNKFQNFTSNLLEIESLPAVKFYLEEEINLLASTTLKSLLNHLYSTRVSVEYAKRMYDLIKMPFKTKIIPDKLSISNIDDYLIGFKDETIKSLDLIINSH